MWVVVTVSVMSGAWSFSSLTLGLTGYDESSSHFITVSASTSEARMIYLR